jgi:RNA polymerase sigma-54 factor
VAIEIKTSLKQKQQLQITPQLQQAIQMLRLSRMELQEFLSQQLAENPILEETGVVYSSEETALQDKEKEATTQDYENSTLNEASNILDKKANSESEIDWDKYAKSRDYESHLPSTQSRKDEEFPNFENIVSKAQSLHEYLLEQLSDFDLNPEEFKLAQLIIGSVDDRGYLDEDWDELAKNSGASPDEIEDMVDLVQRLEPPGVAARDLRESLLNQIRFFGLRNGVVERMVGEHLNLLETRNYPQLAKQMGVSVDEVLKNVQIIAELEPIPGRQFESEVVSYVVPDVYIFKLGDSWQVSMNDDGIPSLRISEEYQDILEKMKTGSADREYLSERLRSAEWLIKSLQQRKKTIFRVTETIVEHQKDFFEKGAEHLRPLICKQVADELGLNQSTVSRATKNKYVHTPRGIFPLKYFFNSAVTQAGGGEGLASESVRNMIAELVSAEDPKNPLSDSKIVEILDQRGLQLARRTVAKYREKLNILPSSKRKKGFS